MTIAYTTVERYCPMCNRKRLTNREEVGPFVVTTCAYCGHVHSVKDREP